MDGTFAKYNAVTRLRQELAYGRTAGRRIAAKDPSVVVISNVPLIAHAVAGPSPLPPGHPDGLLAPGHLLRGHRRRRPAPHAGARSLRGPPSPTASSATSPGAARPWSPSHRRSSSACREWGVADKTTVVPNWAPIDELPSVRPTTRGSRRMGLRDIRSCCTRARLGLKHDPSILALHRAPAAGLAPRRPGRRGLRRQGPRLARGTGRRDEGADNLVLLDFQPYEELPDMMASADVLVAILEPDASKFSVPSKVLTYLCSSRAILGVLPPDNSVAEILSTPPGGRRGRPVRPRQVAHQAAAAPRRPRAPLGHGPRRPRATPSATFSPEVAADRFLERLRRPGPFPAAPVAAMAR